jgi:hypothetical protein
VYDKGKQNLVVSPSLTQELKHYLFLKEIFILKIYAPLSKLCTNWEIKMKSGKLVIG